MSVVVTASSIKRRLSENPGGVLLLITEQGHKGARPELVEAIRTAVLAANVALVDPDGSEHTKAEPRAVVTPKGAVVNMHRVWDYPEAASWLEVFAQNLEGAGVAGKVTAAPIAWPPPDLQAVLSQTALVAFLAFHVEIPDDPDSRGPLKWRADEPTTELIAERLVKWNLRWSAGDGLDSEADSDTDVYVGVGSANFKLDQPFPAHTFADLLPREPSCSITRAKRDLSAYTEAGAGPHAGVTYCLYDQTKTWQERVSQARKALLADAQVVDVGFIRFNPAGASSWKDLDRLRPAFPHISASWLKLNRLPLTRMVPDAHGIQVLGSQHLERANDLSGWEVSTLDQHHYLVQAPDLGPWYSQSEPDPDVLEAARTDFGDMIMTKDSLAADPDGWVPGMTGARI